MLVLIGHDFFNIEITYTTSVSNSPISDVPFDHINEML